MKTTSQMLAGSESERDVFRSNCQKTWTRTLEKGGFVLRMVFLMMCIGFWVLTRNFELNNGNLNCLNPHVQETVGCWSRAKAATISVTNRERVSAKLSKLPTLMANSSYASMMQGRKRAGGKKHKHTHSHTYTHKIKHKHSHTRKHRQRECEWGVGAKGV